MNTGLGRSPSGCIFDRVLTMPILAGSSRDNDERTVQLTLYEFSEFLQLKVRDTSDFAFNYTRNIDQISFAILKNDQSLDIEFGQLRATIMDLLEQVLNGCMLLRAERRCGGSSACRLVFYTKSKIKHIVYLSIDLEPTNQRQIFDEMQERIEHLQQLHRTLQVQMQQSDTTLQHRTQQLQLEVAERTRTEQRSSENLARMEKLVSSLCQSTCSQMVSRLEHAFARMERCESLVRRLSDVAQACRMRSIQQCDANASLRRQLDEQMTRVQQLDEMSARLDRERTDALHAAAELRDRIHERTIECNELREQLAVVEADAQRAALIIAKKASAHEELTKDLVQANQMLVNIHNLYDARTKELEAMTQCLADKENQVQHFRSTMQQLEQDFDAYRRRYSAQQLDEAHAQLGRLQTRIDQLERTNRETQKLNELLTSKLAAGR